MSAAPPGGDGLLSVLLEAPVLIAVGAALLVGGLGGWLTEIGAWYRGLTFPRWKPPNWLFGPAWTLIFALIVAGGVKAWWAAPQDSDRVLLIALFAVNGVLNVAWSGLFFRLRRPDWAGIEVVLLWLSIGALVVTIAPYSPAAAWCLVPYWAWVSFASVLNWAIVRLNPAFG